LENNGYKTLCRVQRQNILEFSGVVKYLGARPDSGTIGLTLKYKTLLESVSRGLIRKLITAVI